MIPTIRYYAWGAPGRCAGALVEELLAAGHEVQLFVAPIDMEAREVAGLKARGARIERLPDPEPDYKTLRNLRRWWDRMNGRSQNLASMVRNFDPDHIFANQGGTWCAGDEAFREVLAGYPGRYVLICHSNGGEGTFHGERLRRADEMAGKAKALFFNSRWIKSLAEQQIGREMLNAVYFQIRPGEECRLVEWPEPTAEVRLAMVTRLDCGVKGIDLAVKALAEVNRDGVRARLDIFGEGEDRDCLAALIHAVGADASVRLMGAVGDVSRVWHDHELLLMPSRTEGLGLAMLEAMSCGRPVLRTPLGGCEEWIEDGVNGFVCPRADVAALVQTIERALAVRERWHEMGLAAHAKIKRELSPRPGRVFLEALQPEAADG